MDLFLLGPAFQAIYGRPMAYIHAKIVERPGLANTFRSLLSLPSFVAMGFLFLGIDEWVIAAVFVTQMALAPLYYAIHAARRETQHMDSTDLMIARYKRKLEDEEQTSKPSSVVLNKRK